MPGKTHGARSLERTFLREQRLRPQIRRMLGRLHQHLAAAPIEAVKELLVARIARKELLAQKVELYALAHDDFEGSKWAVALWNSLRRDCELLYSLPDPDRREVSLTEYLNARAQQQPQVADGEDEQG